MMNTEQILKVLKNKRDCIKYQKNYCFEDCEESCPYYVSETEALEVYDFLIKGYELAETEGENEYVIRCKEPISEEEIARLKELMNESRLTTEVFSGEIEFKPMPLPEGMKVVFQPNEYGREIFKGICPYTNKKCDTWTCNTCEVEARERKFMEGDTE